MPLRSGVGNGRRSSRAGAFSVLGQSPYTPTVDERHQCGEDCSAAHPAWAQRQPVVQVEDADPEHASDDRRERAQHGDDDRVPRRLLGPLDERLHGQADHGPHHDPNRYADPVLHVSPLTTALNHAAAFRLVPLSAVHQGQVDHQPVVDQSETCNVMSTSFD